MNKELLQLSYELKKEVRRKIKTILIFIILIITAITLILNFLIFPVRQTSISMESDISKDSCIMFSELKKNYNRGDVVILKKRSSQDFNLIKKITFNIVYFITARQIDLFNKNHFMGQSSQIRRVIALPGDSIYMRDYVMYIRPKGEKFFLTEFELVEKGYNVNIIASPNGWDTSLGVSGSFDEIELGENEYFVLADNRNSSVDSRLWGPVNKSDISAAAIFQYFPFNKIRLFL